MKPLYIEDWELCEGTVRIMLLPPKQFLYATARISHFLENPVFQSDRFSIGDVQDHWKSEQSQQYQEIFFGSNFSGADVVKFSATYPESDRNEYESWLVRESASSLPYLYFALLRSPTIAGSEWNYQCALTLKHEISHAMYYLNREYRSFIHELWNDVPEGRREYVYSRFSYFYASHRIVDEWAAHILASYEIEQVLDVSAEGFIELNRQFWKTADRIRFTNTLQSLISCSAPAADTMTLSLPDEHLDGVQDQI